MKKPRMSPLLSDLVLVTFSACDGVVFDRCGICRNCGSELSGYDMKKKRFAVIIDNNRKKAIHVIVKRFFCRTCRKIWLADEPFYPGTRIGSPVIDLCITLGTTMPYARVSSCLAQMGIIVDRWSVRNYILNGCRLIPSLDMFGIRLPMSLISLSALAAGIRGVDTIDAAEFLAACTYPAALKTRPDIPPDIRTRD
jgi:hypothetical protein